MKFIFLTGADKVVVVRNLKLLWPSDYKMKYPYGTVNCWSWKNRVKLEVIRSICVTGHLILLRADSGAIQRIKTKITHTVASLVSEVDFSSWPPQSRCLRCDSISDRELCQDCEGVILDEAIRLLKHKKIINANPVRRRICL